MDEDRHTEIALSAFAKTEDTPLMASLMLEVERRLPPSGMTRPQAMTQLAIPYK